MGGSGADQEPAKNAPKPQTSEKQKKPKKAKQAKLAPDEIVDEGIGADGQPVVPPPPAPKHIVWDQHPGIQFGKKFHAEFEAKFQEDGHQSYPDAEKLAGLVPWELHRNRIGVTGGIGKHIEFEVERELTEKELTEKDIEVGLTPKSQWKDVRVNVDYLKNAQIQVGKF